MDFPSEIIKCILMHLDVEDLKRCLLVSQEIRELIIKTPELMRKFDVILFHETWKEKLPFIKKYGYFIRSLKCNDVGFDDENQYKLILKYTPNLERLSFTDCYIIIHDEDERNENDAEVANNVQNAENAEANVADENQPEPMVIEEVVAEEPVNLPDNNENDESREDAVDVNLEENNQQVAISVPEDSQSGEIKMEQIKPDEVIESEIKLNSLTYLHLESTVFAEGVIKYIKSCCKLKHLKLTFYYQEPKTDFTEFVCQQDDLEELNLQGYSDMVFKSLFHIDINQMTKFKLKKLSLECELCHHRHFSSFFRAQAEYIRELVISCYNIDFHYYRILFNNFKRLESIVLPTDWTLNDSRSLLIKDFRLENVKELDLVGSNDDLETFKTFINIFPNVQKLNCENLSNFSLQGILENFQSLTSIHVDNFRCDTMLFVKIPTLKILEIEFLCATGHNFFWEKMTKDCPNIETLHIEEIGNFKLNASIRIEFRIIIQNLRNLRRLKSCKIACCPHDNSLNPDEDANVNERIHEENPYYKVEIDTTAKTIKLSNHFANRCNEEVELLREIVKECDIVEL